MATRAQQLSVAALLAAIFALTIALFTPLALFAGNQDEFAVPFMALLPVLLPWTVLAMLLLAAPAAILSAAGNARYQRMLAALCLLTWLQGNVLVWKYGVLDGGSIDWLAGSWRGVIDALIWIAVLLLALRQYRWTTAFVQAAAAVFLIQCVTAYVNFSNLRPVAALPADDHAARQALADFSPTRNVVHIVMDGFQSDIFSALVDDPANASLRAALTGFTQYPENLGVFPYTQMTVPAYLGGDVYQNRVPADTFVANTLRGNNILSAAADAGYAIDVAAPVSLLNVYAQTRPDYAYGITAGMHATPRDHAVSATARLVDLALFRSVPHFAKALVHRDELWVLQSHMLPADYLQLQYFADIAFLDAIRENLSSTRSQPVYKLLHVMLAHRPTVGTADCRFAGMQATNRVTVIAQAGCGLRRVVALLEEMRARGVYDNSLVVLMADHGAWVPLENFAGSGTVSGMTAGMAMPLLAIKPPGATGPLQRSPALTMVTDVPASIAALMGYDAVLPGIPVDELEQPGDRERQHYAYAYGPNPDHAGYLFPMQEFLVNGSATDPANWRLGRKFLPEVGPGPE